MFLGNGDDASFAAVGTGFFIEHKGVRFLATAQHVAVAFQDHPFSVRVNTLGGGSDTIGCDPYDDPLCVWLTHPDPDVDLAILPWHFDDKANGWDVMTVSESNLVRDEEVETLGINVGDICHAIGLFRLLQGSTRNVPLVHTGHIAMMAGEELIPVKEAGGGRRHVRGYLVELQNMRGLSGAPVLVRPAVPAVARELHRLEKGTLGIGDYVAIIARHVSERILGVWISSWEAPPDEVASVVYGAKASVPVGLGTVVPAGRLLELLADPRTQVATSKWFERAADQMAQQVDAAISESEA